MTSLGPELLFPAAHRRLCPMAAGIPHNARCARAPSNANFDLPCEARRAQSPIALHRCAGGARRRLDLAPKVCPLSPTVEAGVFRGMFATATVS